MSELISRDAVILIGVAPIGVLKDVTARPRSEIIKDYHMNATDPSTLEYGNMTYEFEFTKGYVDKTYGEYILNKTKFTLELRPQGTGSGKPKITLTECVVGQWEYRQTRNAVILSANRGEAKTMAFGTQPA